MTQRKFYNVLREKAQDEIDMMYPSSKDLGKGACCGVIVYLPVLVLFVFGTVSPLSVIAWGAVAGIIGLRMAFYYASERVNDRRNKRT